MLLAIFGASPKCQAQFLGEMGIQWVTAQIRAPALTAAAFLWESQTGRQS